MAEHGAVLVVDDDEGVRDFVSEALRDVGYEVVTAEHGGAALAELEHVEPCVVLLDMRMPVVDGWAFSRRYRARAGRTAPNVVMTPSARARTWCAAIGGDAYLAKPFDLDDLYAVVGRYCGGGDSVA